MTDLNRVVGLKRKRRRVRPCTPAVAIQPPSPVSSEAESVNEQERKQYAEEHHAAWTVVFNALKNPKVKFPRFLDSNGVKLVVGYIMLVPLALVVLQAVSQSGQAVGILGGWFQTPAALLLGGFLVLCAYFVVYGNPIGKWILKFFQKDPLLQGEYQHLVTKTLPFLVEQGLIGNTEAVHAIIRADTAARYQKKRMLEARGILDNSPFFSSMEDDDFEDLLSSSQRSSQIQTVYADLPRALLDAMQNGGLTEDQKDQFLTFFEAIYGNFAGNDKLLSEWSQKQCEHDRKFLSFRATFHMLLLHYHKWMHDAKSDLSRARPGKRRRVFYRLLDKLTLVRTLERDSLLRETPDASDVDPSNKAGERKAQYQFLFAELLKKYQLSKDELDGLIRENLRLVWAQYKEDQRHARAGYGVLSAPDKATPWAKKQAKTLTRYLTGKRQKHDFEANPFITASRWGKVANMVGGFNALLANSVTSACGGIAALTVYAKLFHVSFAAQLDPMTVVLAGLFFLAGATTAFCLTRKATVNVLRALRRWLVFTEARKDYKAAQSTSVKRPLWRQLMVWLKLRMTRFGKLFVGIGWWVLGKQPETEEPASRWQRFKTGWRKFWADYKLYIAIFAGLLTATGSFFMAAYSGFTLTAKLGKLFGISSLAHMTGLNYGLMGLDALLTLVCATAFYVFFCVKQVKGKDYPLPSPPQEGETAAQFTHPKQPLGCWQIARRALRYLLIASAVAVQTAIVLGDGISVAKSVLHLSSIGFDIGIGLVVGIPLFFTMFCVFNNSANTATRLIPKRASIPEGARLSPPDKCRSPQSQPHSASAAVAVHRRRAQSMPVTPTRPVQPPPSASPPDSSVRPPKRRRPSVGGDLPRSLSFLINPPGMDALSPPATRSKTPIAASRDTLPRVTADPVVASGHSKPHPATPDSPVSPVLDEHAPSGAHANFSQPIVIAVPS